MQNVLSLLQTGLHYNEIMAMTLVRFNYVCEQFEKMNEPTLESSDSQIQRVLKDPAIRKV